MSEESGEKPLKESEINPDLLNVIRATDEVARGRSETASAKPVLRLVPPGERPEEPDVTGESVADLKNFRLVPRFSGFPSWLPPTLFAGLVGVGLLVATRGGWDLPPNPLIPVVPASPTPQLRPTPTTVPTIARAATEALIIGPIATPFPTPTPEGNAGRIPMPPEVAAAFLWRDMDSWKKEVERGASGMKVSLIAHGNTPPEYFAGYVDVDELRVRTNPITGEIIDSFRRGQAVGFKYEVRIIKNGQIEQIWGINFPQGQTAVFFAQKVGDETYIIPTSDPNQNLVELDW